MKQPGLDDFQSRIVGVFAHEDEIEYKRGITCIVAYLMREKGVTSNFLEAVFDLIDNGKDDEIHKILAYYTDDLIPFHFPRIFGKLFKYCDLDFSCVDPSAYPECSRKSNFRAFIRKERFNEIKSNAVLFDAIAQRMNLVICPMVPKCIAPPEDNLVGVGFDFPVERDDEIIPSLHRLSTNQSLAAPEGEDCCKSASPSSSEECSLESDLSAQPTSTPGKGEDLGSGCVTENFYTMCSDPIIRLDFSFDRPSCCLYAPPASGKTVYKYSLDKSWNVVDTDDYTRGSQLCKTKNVLVLINRVELLKFARTSVAIVPNMWTLKARCLSRGLKFEENMYCNILKRMQGAKVLYTDDYVT